MEAITLSAARHDQIAPNSMAPEFISSGQRARFAKTDFVPVSSHRSRLTGELLLTSLTELSQADRRTDRCVGLSDQAILPY